MFCASTSATPSAIPVSKSGTCSSSGASGMSSCWVCIRTCVCWVAVRAAPDGQEREERGARARPDRSRCTTPAMAVRHALCRHRPIVVARRKVTSVRRSPALTSGRAALSVQGRPPFDPVRHRRIEYKTSETLPEFARTELERSGFRVTIVRRRKNPNDFPGLVEAAKQPTSCSSASGAARPPRRNSMRCGPTWPRANPVGIRTASHAFCSLEQRGSRSRASHVARFSIPPCSADTTRATGEKDPRSA